MLLLTNIKNSVLLPDYLWKHAGFPMVIVCILFILIGNFSYRSLKYKRYNTTLIYSVFIISVLYFFTAPYVYMFINSFNPFGF